MSNKSYKLRWEPVRVNEKHEIERPEYRAGGTYRQFKKPKMPVNNRAGDGNYNIRRSNFIAPTIRPRYITDFNTMRAQNIAQFGQLVQLSDKTLDKLLGVNIPDQGDREWINEYNRRKRMGETEDQIKGNPPFGRPQKTRREQINFGAQNLGLEGNLAAIKAAVDAGFAGSSAERAVVGAEIVKILNNVSDINKLNDSQYKMLLAIIKDLNIPADYGTAGFSHRFFTYRQYNENKGLINMFLMAKSMTRSPLTNYEVGMYRDGDIYYNINVSNLMDLDFTKDMNLVLDLETQAVVPVDIVKEAIMRGADNGFYDGYDLATGEAEEEAKQAGVVPVSAPTFGTPLVSPYGTPIAGTPERTPEFLPLSPLGSALGEPAIAPNPKDVEAAKLAVIAEYNVDISNYLRNLKDASGKSKVEYDLDPELIYNGPHANKPVRPVRAIVTQLTKKEAEELQEIYEKADPINKKTVLVLHAKKNDPKAISDTYTLTNLGKHGARGTAAKSVKVYDVDRRIKYDILGADVGVK